jgi:hypothetical protein
VSPFKDYPKLALALISLFFDAIFIIQHYFIYGHRYTAHARRLCEAWRLLSGETYVSLTQPDVMWKQHEQRDSVAVR